MATRRALRVCSALFVTVNRHLRHSNEHSQPAYKSDSTRLRCSPQHSHPSLSTIIAMSAYSTPITASVSVDVEILGDLIFPKGDRKMLPSFAEFVQSTLGMPLSSLPPSSDAQQPRSPLCVPASTSPSASLTSCFSTPPTPSIRPLRAIIYPDCAHRGPIKLTEAADLAQFKSSKTSPSRTMSLKGADMSEILHLYGLDLENDLRPCFAFLSFPIAVCTVMTPTGPCNQVHTNLHPSATHIAEEQRTCAWKDCGHKVSAELADYYPNDVKDAFLK